MLKCRLPGIFFARELLKKIMTINWFPGHMHKARKEIKKRLPKIDLIIEVMDARIPYSSENPLVSQFRQNKPCIKLLNKSDLADPLITQKWLDYLEQDAQTKALSVTASQEATIKSLPRAIKSFLPERTKAEKPLRAMIMGIPNVGKSTIINILAGRVIAKVGNEPAVTKRQQEIYLDNNIILSDTPGILWPRIENKNSGYRLAATGAIKDTAMEYEDVALYIIEYLLSAYADRLSTRYKYNDFPTTAEQALEEIGKRRGCLRAGGIVDTYKAADILLNDLRSGALGKLSFETPEIIETEEQKIRTS